MSHERDLARVDITPEMIRDALTMPADFGLSSSADHYDEIGETWALGPIIETRDSSLHDRANRIALIRYLESIPELADDWTITHASHWAVGWVDHLSYRVLDADGEPSRMFRELAVWSNALESYCIADETLLSEMEAEAESENWTEILRQVRRDVVRKAPALESRLDRMNNDALTRIMRLHRIDGESDGDGWRKYDSYEIYRLATALVDLTHKTRRAVRRAHMVRKARRGW